MGRVEREVRVRVSEEGEERGRRLCRSRRTFVSCLPTSRLTLSLVFLISIRSVNPWSWLCSERDEPWGREDNAKKAEAALKTSNRKSHPRLSMLMGKLYSTQRIDDTAAYEKDGEGVSRSTREVREVSERRGRGRLGLDGLDVHRRLVLLVPLHVKEHGSAR